jgi:D-serine deaminase-like pyridoxal phosphate-dependent protein
MNINQLDTPAAVIDLNRFDHNLHKLQSYLDANGIANRPHIKTHKIPQIAQKQIQGGAVGITCQKIGEAEVMADAGIADIFLPYNIIGDAKLERLANLGKRVKLSVTADSVFTVEGYSRMAQRANISLETLVEFDTGAKRCGVQTPDEAAQLARAIASSPGLIFGGLMCYPCNENTDSFVETTRDLLRNDKIDIARMSGGGTPRMWRAHEHKSLTEYRSGMYIYGDRYTLNTGAMKLEEIAFSVVCSIVSRPTKDRGILDGGSKAFSSDTLGLSGHGLIVEYPEANIYALSEEHGHVDFSACEKKPEISERVTIIPNHCCPVSNLFDEVVGVRNTSVEVIWQVAARGKMQ